MSIFHTHLLCVYSDVPLKFRILLPYVIWIVHVKMLTLLQELLPSKSGKKKEDGISQEV